MEFKEWLLTEDPNDVTIGNKRLDWESGGTTFSLFDSFFIYAEGVVDHQEMISGVEFCKEVLEGCLSGDMMPKDVSACLTRSNIKTHGIPGRRAIELMLSLVKSTSGSFAPRITSIEAVPEVIHGRIWIESEVVSFWNDLSHIRRNKGHILEFVRAMGGREDKFRYDVEGELLDYDAFRAGDAKPSPNFDPS